MASIGHTINMLTSFFIQRYNHDKVLTYLHGPRGPDLLQVAFSPMRILNDVKFGNGGDVIFELLGQDGGELLDCGIGVIHGSRRGVRIETGHNDVPRQHQLEVHVVVR